VIYSVVFDELRAWVESEGKLRPIGVTYG
jgi:hypothetical protein